MVEKSKMNAESQMQVAIGLLIETINDKNPTVVETVERSLRKIAKTYPNEVLKSCCQYSERQIRNSGDLIPVVLNIMDIVCQDYIVQIDGDTVLEVITLCMDLMIQKPTFEPHLQLAASSVLVALGNKHCIQIMDVLLKNFQPNVVPHYTILHTMGALASVNTFGVIPYLKTILERILPLLGMLKTDPLKQAFSYALESFSESLLEYTSNVSQSPPDPTIKIADFQDEISTAYEALFTNWLHSKEAKVIESVLNSLSAMFMILSTEKIRQHVQKTIQVLLNLYKKHKEPLPIIKCLVSVVSIASKCDGTLLEPLLTPVLQMLSDLICVSPDYAQPELLRTHSEVLRCFECFSMHYTDDIIGHILLQMKNNNEKDRVKGLLVLTHLINTTDAVIKNRREDILAVLMGMLVENNLRIKMSLMKVIVALAYKGFLINNDIITEKCILFIIKLTLKQLPYKENDFSEASDLQLTADNTLYMITTSVKDLEPTLWDLLLKCLFLHEYYEATIIILRCLTHLSSRKAETLSCEGAFIRSLAILAQPLPNFRGTFALNFLRNIKLFDKQALKSVWDIKIPQLLKYLEQNYDHFNDKEWEDLIFDFLHLLLENVEEEHFKEVLVEKIKEQLPLYDVRRNMEKRLLLKTLAVISCYLTNKKLVEQILNIILQSVKPFDQDELLSCSEAIGISSRSNLRLVLDTLSTIRKEVLIKKSQSIFKFTFIKDQSKEIELERIRFLVITSYGEVCKEAPVEILLQTIESEILQFVLNELQTTKDFIIKKVSLKTLGAIGDCMHPNRNKLHIYMQSRDEVLTTVSSQMLLHNGPEYVELFPVIIPVFTSLIRLPHTLESDQRLNLLKLCFDNVFNASAIYCKLTNENYGNLKLAPPVYLSFSKLNTLVQELLLQTLSPATLDEIVTLLEPWLVKKKIEQRLPALEALRIALQTYLDHVKFAYEGPSTFGQTGLILARIIPRCTDPNKTARKVALDCVCLILSIAGRYEGKMRDHDKQLSNSLMHVQEQITTEDPKLLFNLTTDLANCVSMNIPKFQIGHFAEYLIDGLLDVENSSSNGTSVVLNNLFKLKGGDLQQNVSDLVSKLLESLIKIHDLRTKGNSLNAINNLAQHHLKPIVIVLLQQSLPFDQSTCNAWYSISNESIVISDIFAILKKILKSYPFYEEIKMQSETNRIATLSTLQAICAFLEIFKSPQSHEICKKDFSELFTLLYITLASYINASPPILHNKTTLNREAYKLNPFKIALDALKLFLQNVENAKGAAELYLCTDNLNSFIETVPKITETICQQMPETLGWLVASMGPYIRTEIELQRIGVTVFFGSLLKCKLTNQNVLSENVLEMLLDIQGDSSTMVRKLYLQGLGYGAENLNNDIIYRHCGSLLNVFMQGLDYNSVDDSDVVLQAMLSFSKLLKVVQENHLNQCQVMAAVRIKPLLQQDNSNLRRASFCLLGDLANSIKGSDEAFQEQVNGNLITLILHLCDDDLDVVKSCKYALRKSGHFLRSTKVNQMIQEHILEDGSLQFIQFISDFIKVLAEDLQELFPQLIMACLSYYKSPCMQIRGSAALVTGLLYSQLNLETRKQVSFDTVSYRLLQLLKDENPEVRSSGAEAIAYLFVV
nr:maestro heat-like repeat-containing protein family member 1 [Onthophagus taurus]